MRLETSSKAKEIFGQKFLDLANIGIGALLFGQFIAERRFTLEEALFALTAVIVFYFVSYRLLKGVK